MSTHSSPFPSCFRTATTDDLRPSPLALPPPPPPPPQVNDNTNLTTCLYHTYLGIFSLTWSRTLFGRSLHLNLHSHQTHNPFDVSPCSSPLPSTLSFHLHMKNMFFWKKQGSKRLKADGNGNIHLHWDLTRARFGSGPEPISGFYIAVVVDGEFGLLVGDLVKSAYSRTKARQSEKSTSQALFLRREHVFGNRVYTTTAKIGAKSREITVDCNVNGDGKLSFCVDRKRVLQVKRLKWKFRGNERVDFDGVGFQVSWDVYNWLFEDVSDGHAVFMFRFDKQGNEGEEQSGRDKDKDCIFTSNSNSNNMLMWSQQPWSSCSFGMNEIELRKMRKSMLRTARSSSSSSMSSSTSSCGSNSSVMEWASTEENELTGPVGFSLLVYAWKR